MHPAVIATKPPNIPFNNIPGSYTLKLVNINSIKKVVIPDIAAAILVFIETKAVKLSLLFVIPKALPALKPYQPNHKISTPAAT